MNKLPLNDYLKWVRFREGDIYTYIQKINNDQVTFKDEIDFLNELYAIVLQKNKGLDKLQDEMNNLLFSHMLLINSEFLSADLWTKYDMQTEIQTMGYISTSASDSSTSVGYTPKNALADQSMVDAYYNLTKFGVEYMILLQEMQSLAVVL